VLVRILWVVRCWTLGLNPELETYEWKSATVAFSPARKGMNSWLAPLIIVRGTRLPDTTESSVVVVVGDESRSCRVDTEQTY
jgi:hypothetical protein